MIISSENCADNRCKCTINCNNDIDNNDDNFVSIHCELIDNINVIKSSLSIARNSSDGELCATIGRSLPLPLRHVSMIESDSKTVIDALQQNVFGNDVTSLNITKCATLTQLPQNPLRHLNHLRNLTLSYNNITSFNSNFLFTDNNQLLSLDLSHNQLTTMNLTNLKSLQSLSISGNDFTTLEEVTNFGLISNLKILNMDNNNWNCDEGLIWLLNYIKFDVEDVIKNKDQIRCSAPELAKGMTFVQFVFAKETPLCGKCECFIKNRDATSVNCSGKGLESMPHDLPSNTKIVRLDNNNIKNLTLKLSSAKFWRNVTYLYLNNNTVESFAGLEGTKLLKNLVALNIAHNRLNEIPWYILEQLSHLDELYLADNPWDCDCNTVRFQTWLQHHFKSVKDVENIRCASGGDQKTRNGIGAGQSNYKFSNRILHQIPKSELCPKSNEIIDLIDIVNALLASLIILIVMKLIYDYFWQKRTNKLPKFFRLNVN